MVSTDLPQDGFAVAQAELEQRIRWFSSRYGFRGKDFSLVWDGGSLDPARSLHDLVIATGDGRRSQMQISHEALLARDAWRGVRDIDAALAELQRRLGARGE